MYLGSGHPAFEIVRSGNPVLMDLLDEIDERYFSIVQLLVEVTRQQNDGVFQFAFAALDRMVAEIADHHRSSDRNGCDQENAANIEPKNRIAAARQVVVRQDNGVDRIFSADIGFAVGQHCFSLPAGTGYCRSVERPLAILVIKALKLNVKPLSYCSFPGAPVDRGGNIRRWEDRRCT